MSLKVKIILILPLLLIFISKINLIANNYSDVEWAKRSLSSARAENYLENCIMFAESNNFMEGLKQCRSAIAHKPDYAEAYYEMCNIYLVMARYAEAYDSCKQAVNINPEYKDALIMIDENLNNRNREEAIGKSKEAISEEKADEIFNNHVPIWLVTP